MNIREIRASPELPNEYFDRRAALEGSILHEPKAPARAIPGTDAIICCGMPRVMRRSVAHCRRMGPSSG